jgi:RNA polymerase sigma-70 factor (ECF subfamily)
MGETLGGFVQSLGDMRDPRLKKLFLLYRDNGDVKALGKLFDLLSPELLVVARHLSGDPAEAEDLVQAAFLAALEHPERYDKARPLTPWFVGILSNQAQAWRRKAARSPDADRALEAQHANEQKSRPDRKATDGESAGLVQAALASLPEKYRAVLESHLSKGQSPKAIARELGTSPGTVRVQLHRGLAQLRDLLPAGIAGGLALTLTERGLAQVRTEITTQASILTPSIAVKSGATLAAIKIGSLLMTQRFVLGTLAVIVILAATYLGRDTLWPDNGAGQAGLTSTGLQELAPDVVLVSVDDSVRTEGDTEPDKAVGKGSGNALGSILVSTVWNDGSPAADISFDYTPFGSGAEPRRAQSDRAGTVLLRDLTPGTYGLYGHRSGHASASVERSAHQPERVTLRLAKGVDVKGRIIDLDGRGVAQAEIWITNELSRSTGAVVGHSDADGSFFIRQLTHECFIGARKDGYVRSHPEHVAAWMERSAEAGTVELNITLGGVGAQIGGVVLGPDGQPIAGARVRIGKQADFDSMGPDGPVGPPPQEVVSDEKGEFLCGGLLPGSVEYACKAQGFAVSSGKAQVVQNGKAEIEVRLQLGAWLRGTISTPDGSPAEKVLIYANEGAFHYPQTASSFASPQAETDENGSFELGPLAAGKVGVQAASYDGKQRVNRQIEVAPGESYRWDHALQGLPTISGIAVDAAGNALGGWVVVAKSTGAFGYPSKSVVCKQDGTFELHLMGQKSRRLELHKPGSGGRTATGWAQRGAPRAWKENVPLGSTDVQLVLDPTQAPTGKFSGGLESGLPLGKTKITVRHEWLGGGRTEFTLPARTASFEIPDLHEGHFTIRIESLGCAVLWLREIVLEKGQHLDLGTLMLRPAGGLRVNLQVEGQASLEHALVELHDAENNSWYVILRGNRVEGKAFPAGEYTLKVQAEGCGPAELAVTIVAGLRTELELALVPGGSIGLVLLDAQDRPLGEKVRLVVTSANGATVFDESLDSNEVSRWFFAPYGDLQVVAEASGGRRFEATIYFASTDGTESPHTLKLR